MSDQVRLAAFSDELMKIALVGGVAKRVGSWISKGWNDVGAFGGGNAQWMGKGKLTKYLPVGDKSLITGFTAMGLPSALSKQDPYGMDRSRAERVSGLAGSTLGGLAGAGALMGGANAKFRTLRAIAGGLGGSILGERLTTKPFRAFRGVAKKPAVENQQALLQQAQGGS